MRDIDKYIDLESALNRVAGKREFYKKLLLSFLADPHMDMLNSDLHCGNIEAAARTAHTVKGLSANLSLIELNRSVAELEVQLKQGSYSEDAHKECQISFQETRKAVEEILNTL